MGKKKKISLMPHIVVNIEGTGTLIMYTTILDIHIHTEGQWRLEANKLIVALRILNISLHFQLILIWKCMGMKNCFLCLLMGQPWLFEATIALFFPFSSNII